MFKPTQFGKYYLKKRLAVGGMAEIYQATYYGTSGFEKPIVIKQILPQYAEHDDFVNMFIQEAKVCASLSHGNIVPIFELGEVDGIYYMALEYIDGYTLQELMDKRSHEHPLSVELVLYILVEICKGLEFAHNRANCDGVRLGVVHRDLSPSNIMISRNGEVKIADFGIALATDKLRVTEAGIIKGSQGYMSPEQLQAHEVDSRTDIYTTGILLHELLTGRPLFAAKSAEDIIKDTLDGNIPPPSILNPELPTALDAIVLKALAVNKEDRFSKAEELQLELSRLLYSSSRPAIASTLAHYIEILFPEEHSKQQKEVVVNAKPPQHIIRSAKEEESVTYIPPHRQHERHNVDRNEDNTPVSIVHNDFTTKDETK